MIRPLLICALLVGCGGVHNPDAPVDRAVVPDCSVQLDGRLTDDEVPAAPGIEALYVRNALGRTVPVDIDGDTSPGAVRWDFSTGPRDVGLRVVLEEPDARGWSARFPDADWVAPPAIETPDLVAPMRRGEHGLEVLGAASVDGAWDLVYDEPLLALPLPLAEGDAWTQEVQFRNARVAGLPNAGIERWSFTVDASGAAALPGGITVEEVLRVRSTVSRAFSVSDDAPRVEHRIQWLAPCFGEVARAQLNGVDSDTASELRRLEP